MAASSANRNLQRMVAYPYALDAASSGAHWKSQGLRLKAVLAPEGMPGQKIYHPKSKPHLRPLLDRRLIDRRRPRSTASAPVKSRESITTGRSSGAICRHVGQDLTSYLSLPHDTIQSPQGNACQFVRRGWLDSRRHPSISNAKATTIRKGLSAGAISVKPPRDSGILPEAPSSSGQTVM